MIKNFSQSDKKIFTKWQKNFHKVTKNFSQSDKNFSQSDKKFFTKWQKNFHKVTKNFSQNFDKYNKIDCLFLFEIIKKTNSLSSHLHCWYTLVICLALIQYNYQYTLGLTLPISL